MNELKNNLTIFTEARYANGMNEGNGDDTRVGVAEKPKSGTEYTTVNPEKAIVDSVVSKETPTPLSPEEESKVRKADALEKALDEKEKKLQADAKKAWEKRKDEEDEEDETLKLKISWMTANGIPPEAMERNPELFRNIFAATENGPTPEKVGKCLKSWRRALRAGEYASKIIELVQFSTKGVDFQEYLVQYPDQWERKFSTPLTEALKNNALLSWFLMQVWALLKEDLMGTGEQKDKDDEEAEKKTGKKVSKEKKQDIAEVAWKLTNEYRNNTRDKVSPNELPGQNELIEKGVGPQDADADTWKAMVADARDDEVHLNARIKEDTVRAEKAASFITMIAPEVTIPEEKWQEFEDKIKKIHLVGEGEEGRKKGTTAAVGNYKMMSHIGEKITMINSLLKQYGVDIDSPKNREKVRQIRDSLLKSGILGVEDEEDDDLEMPGGQAEAMGLTLEQFDKWQDIMLDLLKKNRELTEQALTLPEVSDYIKNAAKTALPVEAISQEAMKMVEKAVDALNYNPKEQGRTQKELNKIWRDWMRELQAEGVMTSKDFENIKEAIDRYKQEGRIPSETIFKDLGITRRVEKEQEDVEEEIKDGGSTRKAITRKERQDGKKGRATFDSDSIGKERQAAPEVDAQAIFFHPDWRKVRDLLEKGYTEEEVYERLYEEQPSNAEELAWQMSRVDSEKWGVGGQFPLLKEVFDKNGNSIIHDIKLKDRNGEVIKEWTIKEFELDNWKHILRWVRARKMHLHGQSPDGEYNFFRDVVIPKRPHNTYSLGNMVGNEDVIFKSGRYYTNGEIDPQTGEKMKITVDQYTKLDDEEKKKYKKYKYETLSNKIQLEPWQFGDTRVKRIKYVNDMGADTKLPGVISGIYFDNLWTKTVSGKSGDYWISQMEEKAGYAERAFEQAYYYISDFEKLQQILGKDAAIFTHEGMKRMRDKLALDEKLDPDKYISDELLQSLFKDGKPNLGKEGFMDFVNLFSKSEKEARFVKVTRELVKEAVAKKLDMTYINNKTGQREVDTDTVDYAEQFAMERMRPTGAAARNDMAAAGYDAWIKTQDLDDYRKKQMRGKSGGAHGNPYTVHMLKRAGVGLYEGIRTETVKYIDKFGVEHFYSPLEVFDNMDRAWEGVTWDNEASVAAAQAEYDRWSAMLIYPDNTMRQFATNHSNRSFQLFEQIISGQELKLEKFTKVSLKGVTFDRDQFSEVVNEKFIKLMRYAYSTWGQLDYSQMVRTKVPAEKGSGKDYEMKYVSLAESMFGKELLDIEAFWRKDYELDEKGRVKKDKDGNPIVLKVHEHDIDAEEINANKEALWKQVAKGRIAAEIWSHVDWHSVDPRFNWLYYENIIKALETIPGGITGDEFDMQKSRPNLDPKARFFSPEDIKWIREKAGIKNKFKIAVGLGIGKGLLQGIWEVLKTGSKYALDLK